MTVTYSQFRQADAQGARYRDAELSAADAMDYDGATAKAVPRRELRGNTLVTVAPDFSVAEDTVTLAVAFYDAEDRLLHAEVQQLEAHASGGPTRGARLLAQTVMQVTGAGAAGYRVLVRTAPSSGNVELYTWSA